jgi:DNA-binding CsgD family transcriptional regulator
VIESIYDAASAPSRWPETLQRIADGFGDVGANLIWRRDDGRFGTITSPGLVPAQEDYEKNWAGMDIRAERGFRIIHEGLADAVTDRHFASEEELANHPIYAQFLERHGLRWVAATQVTPDPRVSVAIAIQRASAKPPFSDEELTQLIEIGRHCENALRLTVRIMDAEVSAGSLSQALSRLGAGVFLLDEHGNCLFSNEFADSLARQGVFLVQPSLRLASGGPSPFADRLKATLTAGSHAMAARGRPMLVRDQPGQMLAIHLLPADPALGSELGLNRQPRVIVLIIGAGSKATPDPALVRDLLNLTLGEARVAALVGTGMAPKNAAEALGLTEESIRTTLKRVYSKVGVNSQSALTALVSRFLLR